MEQRNSRKKIRYAVVGLGHIAQIAVLPAFRHARRNSELTALVSGDAKKLEVLGKKYRIRHPASYDQYDDLLRSGEIDAVYIALPNSLHAEYSIRAANAGIHVLCEKPMAVTAKECAAMIRAARKHHVKLMIAYRLHFEEANLQAIQIVKSGKIGEPRFFNSLFSLQVKEGNIRTRDELGGGTLYDLGIYCINAARYLFQAEPQEVFAYSSRNGDRRFREIDEMSSALLRFPDDRLGTFTSSFGAMDAASYEIVGTKGRLRVDPAYEYAMALRHHLTVGEKTTSRTFRKRDQFAPELLYFSDCIIKNREPEPSGSDGLADVRVIEALYRSAAGKKTGQADGQSTQEETNAEARDPPAPGGRSEAHPCGKCIRIGRHPAMARRPRKKKKIKNKRK
jgi:glucose-fructose oxidoreductase